MNAKELKDSAERCLRLASAETNEELKRQLIALADNYREMARQAEAESPSDKAP